MKTEAMLVSAFVKRARLQLPKFVILRHEDQLTGGVPDLSVTGNGFVSWWEFKHGVPGFTTKGLQELTCNRLAKAGFCRYVIYQEGRETLNRTLIVHPRDIKEVIPEAETMGFDHQFVIDYIQNLHGMGR